jgi:hypothetical protein
LKRVLSKPDLHNTQEDSTRLSSSSLPRTTTITTIFPPKLFTLTSDARNGDIFPWFSLPASSEAMQDSGRAPDAYAPSRQDVPTQAVVGSGWPDNDYGQQIMESMPDTGSMSCSEPMVSGWTSSSARTGSTATIATPDRLPAPASPRPTDDKHAVTSDMHAADGHEITDFDRKLMALLESAGNGNVESQYEIADIYGSGMVEGKGLDDAIIWLERAADAGHAGAQRNLVRLLDPSNHTNPES